MSGSIENTYQLKVAGIVIEAYCDDSDIELVTAPNMRPFLSTDEKPHCRINTHYTSLPDIEIDDEVFNTQEGPWRLYRSGEKLIFQMVGTLSGQTYIHRMAIIDQDFSQCELFVVPFDEIPGNSSSTETAAKEIDPLMYPLDTFLIVNLLAQNDGINVHASGVVHHGNGLIFCGDSGAGKSTLAKLWKERNAVMLSDERVAIRDVDGRIQSYGTPWQSSARVYSSNQAPLQVIYFLVQSKENRIVKVDDRDLLTWFFVCHFAPEYLREGWESSLDVINKLMKQIPCYELHFTPDQRAIDTVLNHVENL